MCETFAIFSSIRINSDGHHGGTTPEQREVPLFIIPPDGRGKGDTGETVSQLPIALTVLKLLDIPISSSSIRMKTL